MTPMRTGGLLLLAALLLGGCKTQAEINAALAVAKDLHQRENPDYVIGDGDSVTINVLGQEDLEITAAVRPDGYISFPRHGEIRVAGRTVEQLQSELETEFKTTLGLVDPQVFVSVNTFGSKSITVLGAVFSPGRFPFTGQMRVSDVLGSVRGIDVIRSAPNRTLLFREEGGVWKAYQVKLNDFIRENDWSTNYYVKPGDIIFVPRNGYARFANSVETVVLPFTALLSPINVGSSTVNLFVP